MKRTIQVAACSNCANCEESFRLNRCSGCKLSYYCSKECQKRHWNLHKAECQQAQGVLIAKCGDLSPNHPFDNSIRAFEAGEFTEASFIRLCKNFYPIIPCPEPIDGTFVHIDLRFGVTESGYQRLLTLAARALNQYSGSYHVSQGASIILLNYKIRFSASYSQADTIYNANLLEPILRVLKEQKVSKITPLAWSMLSKVFITNRKSNIEALDAAGIFHIAIETFRVHGGNFSLTHGLPSVLNVLAKWLYFVRLQKLTIPPYDASELITNILQSMGNFPVSPDILGDGCQILDILLSDDSRDSSYLTELLLPLGAYELLAAAIKRFPKNLSIVSHGSSLISMMAEQYFVEQSMPRNIDMCVSLAASLQHFPMSQCILKAIRIVASFSRESGVKFIHRADGLRHLNATLEASMNYEEIVSECSLIISSTILISFASSADYPGFLPDLEQVTFPSCLNCFKLHLHSGNATLVYNIMSALVSIISVFGKPNDDVTVLFRTVKHLYPTQAQIQEVGAMYLEWALNAFM